MTFLGVHDEDLPALQEKVNQLVSNDVPLVYVCRIFHEVKGEYRFIRLEGSVSEEEGTRLFYVVYSDISEQKQLEKEMESANEKMQDIVNSIPGGVAVYKISDIYETIYFSDGVPQLSGYTTEEYRKLAEGDAAVLTYWEDTLAVKAKVKEVISARGSADMEFRKQHRDGHVVWVRTHMKWIGEMDGCPLLHCVFFDITEEVKTRQEKQLLDQYFQTLVKKLPGGVSVIRCDENDRLELEYLSDGYAALSGLSPYVAWDLYRYHVLDGFHPEDHELVREKIHTCIADEQSQCEILCRLKRNDGGYTWVKGILSRIQDDGSYKRIYAVYHDITKEHEEQERLRQKYQDLILKHYRTPGADTLILAHCNITKRRILEVNDYTDSGLLAAFGDERDTFFSGISGFIVDEEERRAFLGAYLSEPALASFAQGKTEEVFEGFVQFPKDERGRYVRIEMDMVATPDSGDITGILTVTDVTDRTITDKILRQLYMNVYDFIVDLDLSKDSFTILTKGENANNCPPVKGCHSEWTAHMLKTKIVPKDVETYRQGLDPERMKARLEQEGTYTFTFSINDEAGKIRTKNMTVSAIDLRLGRISLVRTDITNSVRELQGLLNIIAYTFEMMGFIEIASGHLTMYTRRGVQKNLPPETFLDYRTQLCRLVGNTIEDEEWRQEGQLFLLDSLLDRLSNKPTGFDFVLPCRTPEGTKYKQINVLWGDENHQTICLVRADVTDILTAERQSKQALEQALIEAKEANEAKSDFLSTMSHDIRTPLNAIMGMTEIAFAHLTEQKRVLDCLQKISVSSNHLLSLVNDILDMSKIEQSKVVLSQMKISLPEIREQLCAMMAPQATAAGLRFCVDIGKIDHEYFYGDGLRINQILINILGNAIKFTPEGGQVDFKIEELSPMEGADYVRYRFTVKDTGIGMTEEFIAHIFEPFTRSREGSRVQGTGLGLSITKALVDLMGGTISLESQVNKGTIFRVELEFEISDGIEESTKDSLEAPERDETPFAGMRFLVAEDNEINAEITCEILRINGGESVIKPNGVQVVKTFAEAAPGTYDAILMDIQMPEMNGYEAARTIRRMERQDAADIPIIAMTANAFAEDVQAAFQAGMNAHVPKPLNVEILRKTLIRILKKSKE